jgi:type IV/VI secretion system ImpK/VasF family protein
MSKWMSEHVDPIMIHVLDLIKRIRDQQDEPPNWDTEWRNLLDQLRPLKASERKSESLSARALSAWIDESVESSKWQYREQWINRALCVELFNPPRNAGEDFYKAFHEVGELHSDQRDVAAIFFLCAALGFRGVYVEKNNPEAKKLLGLPNTFEEWVQRARPRPMEIPLGSSVEPAGAESLGGKFHFLASAVLNVAIGLALAVTLWWTMLSG